MATIRRRALTMCAVAVLVIGCAAGNGRTAANGAKIYAVTAEKTAFFHYGPQQGNGPDMQLPKDTLMTLIRPSFGYCKVHLTSGGEGYVAKDDIQVASPALVAAVTVPPPSSAVHGRGEERFNLN